MCLNHYYLLNKAKIIDKKRNIGYTIWIHFPMKKHTHVEVPRAKNPDSCAEYVRYSKLNTEEVLRELCTRIEGLADEEVRTKAQEYGLNVLTLHREDSAILQLLKKFLNPLIVVLLIIAASSYILGDIISATLVSSMAGISVLLSFTQEYKAGNEAKRLSEMVKSTATVCRKGTVKEVPIRFLVPGDIVELVAGDMIPADLRILSSKDLFINQSAFTGESFPVKKFPDSLHADTCELSDMQNIAFMGSSVVSGSARAVVIQTGAHTQFGEISKELTEMSEVSGFDEGIKKLTWLMIRFMVVLVIAIFVINTLLRTPWTEALLFSLAVAVGLTPEMLPMLVTLNLSKGAIAMSKKSVIVKRLNAMQNFGAMDILCTDKTGTLTLNKVVLEQYCDVAGKADDSVLEYAYVNSFYQTGMKDLLDTTILHHEQKKHHHYEKIDEIPFDFMRKIMSVIVKVGHTHRLIAKGAPEAIFDCCTHYEQSGTVQSIDAEKLRFLRKEYDLLSAQGFRVLAIAYKDTATTQNRYEKKDEKNLILKGYLAFLDPPKASSMETIKALNKLGIEVKILTGDHPLVTKKICADVGLSVEKMLTGDDIEKLSEHALQSISEKVTVFARLSPIQKERVIRALRAKGHIVGYMGDGINDAPALKAADVGISVNNAVDIAKESADIILLKKSLMVLRDGVVEGRKTFANILKYIRMGTSSNLGNMFSMTAASLFLPFLPMLPIQILFNNFLYDLSQLAIPTDEVDEEFIAKPHQWNIKAIKHFMIVFGSLSSVFDLLTFALLIWVFRSSESQFHTAWFLVSLCTQTLVIHVIRTAKKPFTESRSSTPVLLSSVLFIIIGCLLPFSMLGPVLEFVPLGGIYFLAIVGIVSFYLYAVQRTKEWFIQKYGYA